MPSFNDLPLQPATQAVLASMEITEPTPIQAEAIPALLAGKNLVGQSATGSGKTLSYIIPIVERLARDKRIVQALVLVPTRELATQVNTVLNRLASRRKLSTALLVGGKPYGSQLSALRYGAQIVVGTPGRVKDHLERGSLVLSHLRMCILDEADQMLDIGFAPVIEEILATTPANRQMALFSATIPAWVAQLEQKFLNDPIKINILEAQGTPSSIEQIAYQVPQAQKIAALCTLLRSTEGESTLIFGRTKYGVEKLGQQLTRLGFKVGTLHGNKSQRAREDVLGAFRRGQVQTLLATNVAARGLDIQGLYQVINYELPESGELFTHRIGRTGRMGKQGKAITLLVPADVPKWRRMARNLGRAITLQQLAIDEDAMITLAQTNPETSITQEHGENKQPGEEWETKKKLKQQAEHPRRQLVEERGEEYRPERTRRQFAPGQERGRFARPMYDNPTRPGLKRQYAGDSSSKTEHTSSWWPDGFRTLEHSSSDSRGEVGQHPRPGRDTTRPQRRTGAKSRTRDFGAAEPQYRPARPGRKKSGGTAKTEEIKRKLDAKRAAKR